MSEEAQSGRSSLVVGRRSSVRRTKPLEHWLTRQVMRGLIGSAGRLSHRGALAVGAGIGSASYALFPRYRRVALANLTQVYGGEWTARQIEAAAREAFRNVGRTLVEFARMPAMAAEEIERLMRFDIPEHLDVALAHGRGALLVTAHFGNWELMGARMVQHGYTLNVIARPVGEAALDATINTIRERAGYRVIERRQALRPALECLRRNESLALLMDQNALASNVWVPFFGRPAATNTGAAVLARRTGAPLVPAFDHRMPDGTHVGRVHPPIFVEPTDDKERDIREITARLTQIIEDEVRGDPTQWLWLHNRWKHQPGPGDPIEHPASHYAVQDSRG